MTVTREIIDPLLQWYDSQARVLPWREEPTPYRVWISEIMLQQTRVEAVKPYFERFLEKLPSIESLAAVPEDELLKLWEGLGYYNRARNLQKSAKELEANYHSILPQDVSELMKLPGIGSYTAGAISSIAYGQKAPAVDGNVLRVIARVMADTRDILDAKVKKTYEEALLEIMPESRSGDFNQALMELGAMICIPNGAPKCYACPWNAICKAKSQGIETALPVKAKKKKRIIENKTVLIIQDENKTAIRKRPDKGLLAGLYEFPNFSEHKTQKEIIEYVASLGYQSIRIQKLENSKHIFTHREWNMEGYLIRVDELARPKKIKGAEGYLLIESKIVQEKYPIPTAFAAYAKYININVGNIFSKIE